MLKFLRLTAAPSVALLVLIAGCSTEQPQVISPAPTPTPSLSTQTAASPIASDAPSLSPQTDPFQEANDKAIGLANISQSAQSKYDWGSIAVSWQELIDLMKAVPKSSPNYVSAQKKVTEYQRNLAYAKQQAAKPVAPPDSTVKERPTGASTGGSEQTVAQRPTESSTEGSARSFLESYLQTITNQGSSGHEFWCSDASVLESSFFAPRGAQILNMEDSVSNKGHYTIATVRVDSSNEGGQQITKNWSFYMKNDLKLAKGRPGNWCMKAVI